MYYFQQFPTTLTTDYNNNKIVVKNILNRAEVIPNLLKNQVIFYNYDISDGDTPEIIGNKYYSDPYRYWIVGYSNQILDLQSEWPMSGLLFIDYIMDKYQGEANTYYSLPSGTNANSAQILAYTQTTIQNYIKSVQVYDSNYSNTTTTLYVVDSNAYANITNTSQPLTLSFPNGSYSTITITKYTQSIYDYEVEQNEQKRAIQLLDKSYAGSIENQFSTLIGK
jgi:hypothetical protein